MKGAHILLADDSLEMRSWLRDVLEAKGAQIVEAHSGAELARQLMQEGPFDLVIADVRMSWATGLQVLAMTRTAGNGVPFLVITGYADDLVRERVRRLGAELLEKPFEAEELVALAGRMLPPAEQRGDAVAGGAASRLLERST